MDGSSFWLLTTTAQFGTVLHMALTRARLQACTRHPGALERPDCVGWAKAKGDVVHLRMWSCLHGNGSRCCQRLHRTVPACP